MHDRLLPLNPPLSFTGNFTPHDVHQITLMTMPWMQIGLFAVMIVMMVRYSTY